MKCAHCGVENNKRERSGGRCKSCKREFVLEPKDGFRRSDLNFKAQAKKLSADGTLFYTPTQLFYYVCRSRITKPVGLGVIVLVAVGVGVLCGLWGRNVLFAAAFGALALCVGVLYYMLVQNGHPALMVSADSFPDILRRWQKVYGAPPQGLIVDPAQPEPADELLAPEQVRAVLTCPEREVLRCLRANHAPQKLGLALLPGAPPFTPAEEATLSLLRARRLPLLLLHDANLDAYRWRQDVRSTLGLPGSQRVLDLGLRQNQLAKRKLPVLLDRPRRIWISWTLRRRLRLPLPPVDPAISQLSAAEQEWLQTPYCSPILALTPARLLKMLTAVMDKLGARQPRTPAAQAAAIGFMTWPDPR